MQAKTIIITGAASGIGRATALRLHAAGWHIGLFDINREQLTGLQDQLASRCEMAVVDVTDADAFREAIDQFVATTGRLNAIFNCAGIIRFGNFEEIALEQHERTVDINIRGVLNGCYLAFPHLKKQPGSAVVSMSSASSLYGIPSLANYSASKFWVKGLTEALSIEWKPYGIRVSAIEPPFVKTPLLEGQEAPIVEAMGIHLTAEHIAATVARALNQGGLHYPVSLRYRVLRALCKLMPQLFTTAVIRRMAGY